MKAKPKENDEQTEQKEKEPLTREGFFKILDKVIRPKTEPEKPQEPEKKETSE